MFVASKKWIEISVKKKFESVQILNYTVSSKDYPRAILSQKSVNNFDYKTFYFRKQN